MVFSIPELRPHWVDHIVDSFLLFLVNPLGDTHHQPHGAVQASNLYINLVGWHTRKHTENMESTKAVGLQFYKAYYSGFTVGTKSETFVW